jgi:hypothetical protein
VSWLHPLSFLIFRFGCAARVIAFPWHWVNLSWNTVK